MLLATLFLCAPVLATANECFTVHSRGELHCREIPAGGKPLDIYDSGESPGRARTLFLKRGNKVCEDSRCRRCLGTNAKQWLPCGEATSFALRRMEDNGESRIRTLVLAAGFLIVLAGALVAGLRRRKPTSSAAAPNGAAGGAGFAFASSLLRFAASWWFPWVAALGTGLNLFTLIFTAATVVLFLTAVLARRERWASTAVANAIGATAGTALLLAMIRARGDPLIYLQEAYPTVLANPAWQKAMGYMDTYGVTGMFLVASLPIFLHPIIAFGLLAGMSNTTILSIVLSGRTLKYLIMAKVTTSAPHLLRFFGIKMELVEAASTAAKKLE